MKKILAILLVCACATAYAQSGKIKICRHPGITAMLDRQKITVPAKSSFTTMGENGNFVVATSDDTTLGVKPGCAIVSADITENQGHKSATRKSGRLGAQFVTVGADLEAFVVEDFK